MTMSFPSSTPHPLQKPSALGRWFAERRAILTGIGVGSVTWPLAFGATWLLWPEPAVVPHAERVAYALGLLAAPALILFAMISACMRLFDRAGAENPFASAESPRFKINQRVITNTLEQAAVFGALVLALATRLPDAELKLLPVAVAVWCAGRLLFWAGYHVAPHWRAPGFDWTLMTAALLGGCFVYTLF